jgi:hypothetical protein
LQKQALRNRIKSQTPIKSWLKIQKKPIKTIKQQMLEDLNRSTSFPEVNRISMADSHALIRNISSNLA